MEIIAVFAMIGMFINDLLAILSVIGSAILLFGVFSKAPLRRYGKIVDWSIVGLCIPNDNRDGIKIAILKEVE